MPNSHQPIVSIPHPANLSALKVTSDELALPIIEWGLPSTYKDEWVDSRATLFACWTINRSL